MSDYNSKKIVFNSFSLLFLMKDLEKVLFHVAEYPWDDIKYKKRLNRLIYLYFIDMFIKLDSNHKRKKRIKIVKKKINEPFKPNNTTQTKPTNKIQNLDRLLFYYNIVAKKSIQNYNSELEDFINTINVNLNIIYEAFININNYCDNGPGDINEHDLYSMSIKNLT